MLNLHMMRSSSFWKTVVFGESTAELIADIVAKTTNIGTRQLADELNRAKYDLQKFKGISDYCGDGKDFVNSIHKITTLLGKLTDICSFLEGDIAKEDNEWEKDNG